GGGALSGGGAVYWIAMEKLGQVHLGAHGMDEMIPANSVTVSTTTRADHFEFVIAQLRSRRHGKGTAMQRVHAVGIDEARQVGGTADAADHEDLLRFEPQLEERGLQRRKNGKIPAAG